jgi:Phosphotransferase enzyme family
LICLHFDQICHINKDQHGDFCIGPIPGIGGPFCNSADYYRAWALSQRENPPRRGKSDPFPERVSSAAEFLSVQPSGPFTLSHPDFGYHNFIVDDDYNMVAVVDWDGARVLPVEFSAAFPMFLSSLHPIFWEVGRFDDEERRGEEAELKVQQAQYVEMIAAEAERCKGISTMVPESRSLRVMIAGGMLKYEVGNLNPWEWLIDLMERGINDVDSGAIDYPALRGKLFKGNIII